MPFPIREGEKAVGRGVGSAPSDLTATMGDIHAHGYLSTPAIDRSAKDSHVLRDGFEPFRHGQDSGQRRVRPDSLARIVARSLSDSDAR